MGNDRSYQNWQFFTDKKFIDENEPSDNTIHLRVVRITGKQ